MLTALEILLSNTKELHVLSTEHNIFQTSANAQKQFSQY